MDGEEKGRIESALHYNCIYPYHFLVPVQIYSEHENISSESFDWFSENGRKIKRWLAAPFNYRYSSTCISMHTHKHSQCTISDKVPKTPTQIWSQLHRAARPHQEYLLTFR